MYKVVLWGMRTEYEYYRKGFETEILKGNIHIEAIVFNEGLIYKKVDGIDVVEMSAIREIEYDYIIDMNQQAREMVRRVFELLEISLDRVVPARLFNLPFFDFKSWVQVKESKISIISGHCWGGYAYNTLGLKFRSPFINMFLENQEFFKLLNNLEDNLQLPLTKDREEYEVNLERYYPVVHLGDIEVHFNHYTNFEEAVEIWNRRKQRINYNNLFVEMTAKTEEDIEQFLELPYAHKICYTMLPCEKEGVISIASPFWEKVYGEKEWNYALRTAMANPVEFKCCNLLKLLNHEKDYLRTV